MFSRFLQRCSLPCITSVNDLHHLDKRFAQLFISYDRTKSSERAAKIGTFLTSNGYATHPKFTLSHDDVGFPEPIYTSDALRDCDIFLPILTDGYDKSSDCILELRQAWYDGLPFILLYDQQDYLLKTNIEITSKHLINSPSLQTHGKSVDEFGDQLLKNISTMIYFDRMQINKKRTTRQLTELRESFERLKADRERVGSIQLLDLIREQYGRQQTQIEATINDLNTRMNVETLSSDEFEEIELLTEILQLQLRKHQEYEVIQQELNAKDEIISKLSTKQWEDYHLFFDQFLLYNMNMNQRLISFGDQMMNMNQQMILLQDKQEDMSQTVKYSAQSLEFIKEQVNKIKAEDKNWASKLKGISSNVGENMLTDGAKELISQTVELLDKL